jgi:hypothetical protein
MGEIDSRLDPDENNKLTDAAPLGRSKSTLSTKELTEYSGAAYVAFNLLEARVNVLDSLGVDDLVNRLSADTIAILEEAEALGRSKRVLSKPDLTEFSGSLYLSYEALAIRVGTLEGGGPGTEMEGRLEAKDNARLVEAGAPGRSKSQLSNKELTEWAGATDAAYVALEARVAALEAAT